MKTRAQYFVLTSLLAMILISLSPVSALAAGQTAKAALPKATAAAKKWQADAILVHLSSMKVLADGKAKEWKYAFYAPKSKKRCVVTAREGSVKLREVRIGNYDDPLGEFIDSDKAMAIAKKHDLVGNEPSMSVMRPTGAKADSTTWIVTGGWNMGVDTTISLEAKSGKFSHHSVLGKD